MGVPTAATHDCDCGQALLSRLARRKLRLRARSNVWLQRKNARAGPNPRVFDAAPERETAVWNGGLERAACACLRGPVPGSVSFALVRPRWIACAILFAFEFAMVASCAHFLHARGAPLAHEGTPVDNRDMNGTGIGGWRFRDQCFQRAAQTRSTAGRRRPRRPWPSSEVTAEATAGGRTRSGGSLSRDPLCATRMPRWQSTGRALRSVSAHDGPWRTAVRGTARRGRSRGPLGGGF